MESSTVMGTREALEPADFPWPMVTQSTTFGFIWLMAVIGNLLITCTLLRRGLLNSPSNRLVFSVTLSNLIFSFCVFPCILVSSIKQQWIFGFLWCYVNAFFTILVTVASSATCAAIALDRYVAIVRPMHYSRKMTRSRANALLIFAWCLGLLCALPPCFGWSTYEYQASYRGCFLSWTSSLSYSIVLLIVTFCFPLVSMLICYYSILQVARTKCKRINVGIVSDASMTPLERTRSLPVPSPTPCELNASTVSQLGHGYDTHGRQVIKSESQMSIGRSLRRNRFSFNGRKPSFSWLSSTSSINSTTPVKGMRTIFLLLAAFLLTWIPMVVLAILDMVHAFRGPTGWIPPAWLYIFAMWSMCAGSVTYPILYGIYNRAIRKELRLCLSWSPKKWRMNHFYNEQRRGSKWSNYSEYAALRPRENSASGTTGTVSQKSFTDSMATLQTRESSFPARKSSQDSGALIPSDDEDLAQRCSLGTSSTHQGGRAVQERADGDHHLVPSWRALKPRMALAVLTVSLQHIAVHSKSRQTSALSTTQDDRDNVATDCPHTETVSASPSISLNEAM